MLLQWLLLHWLSLPLHWLSLPCLEDSAADALLVRWLLLLCMWGGRQRSRSNAVLLR